MNLQSQKDVEAVNSKFNHFHDGFIKQISVTSNNEFLTQAPWEEQKHFNTNEEELLDTGLWYIDGSTVEVEIHHYNYDWPNQPRQRSIILRASPTELADNLLSFVGMNTFSLEFTADAAGISCVLTYHKEPYPCFSLENGARVVLFTAPEIDIVETTWAE